MANRFPLIFNSGAGQIQELAASDNLDLTSSNLVNAGILSTSSGSVTAPSLQIGSGTTYNPGLYSPGTDQLAVATNGTGRLFVDASGNIGVGVSSPQHPVHIDGTSGSVQFRAGVTYAGTGLDIKATENNDVTIDVNDSTKTVARALVVSQAGSERLRITAGGLVGIGTGSVNTKLEIAGNNDAVTENNTLRFTDTDANTEANQQIGKIEFYSSDASTPGAGVKAYIGAFAADTTPDAYLAFATQDGSVVSTPVERVRITSDGKLGIGVTGPTQKLQVTDGTLSNFYVAPGYNSGSGTLLATGGSEYLAFATNGLTNERARIDSSGRLLVGTVTSRSVQDFAGNGPESLIQIEAANSTAIMSIISAGTADASRGGTLSLGRHRNATVGATPTVVQSGDLLGAICFAGGDGTDMLTKGASIACQVDGTPGADRMPGRLIFSTATDASPSVLTERMRISSAGRIDTTTDQNVVGIKVANTNNSFTATGIYFAATRSASTAYDLLAGYSSGDSDPEFRARGDGNTFCDGAFTGGGADYAEYFEWSDSNPDEEDRRGISVALDGDKIRKAVDGEDPIGVISGNPSVVGDSAWNKWSGKYLRDEFGTYIQEDYEVEDEDGNIVIQQRRKLNPAYDPEAEYIPREQRPEWDCVGLMGKLRIRKGQVTGSRWIKMRNISDFVEEWLVR